MYDFINHDSLNYIRYIVSVLYHKNVLDSLSNDLINEVSLKILFSVTGSRICVVFAKDGIQVDRFYSFKSRPAPNHPTTRNASELPPCRYSKENKKFNIH